MKRVKSLLAAFAIISLAATPALAAAAWQPQAPIPPDPGGGGISGRTEGACTAAIGDNIYVAYGFDPFGGDTHALRIYDIAHDTWSLGPNPPPPPRSEGYRGVAHGGKLYCIGGRFAGPLTLLERFDPATNTWATLAPMPSPRAGSTAVVRGDSIFVFGGRTQTVPCTPFSPTATNSILRYDVATNVWSPAGSLAVARSDATAAKVGDLMYIFGGCNSSGALDSVEVYNPVTQTSTLLLATMPGGARSNAAAATHGDLIHVLGGTNGFATSPPVADNHLVFDPKTGSFTVSTPTPTHCSGATNRAEFEAVAHGDQLFAVGGACPFFGNSLNNLDKLKLNP